MKMKKLILLAMTPVLFTACGNDDPKKVSPSSNNNINKITNQAVELNVCSEDNVKSYQTAVDAANKATTYFAADGSITPAGQFVDVNAVGAATKTACSYFVDNYGPIDCKTTLAEASSETIIRGSEVAKNCDSAIKFLESIGR